jgi:mono/diheme cytochrome c family protein
MRRYLTLSFFALVVLAACNLLDPNPGPTPITTSNGTPSTPVVNMKVDTAIGERLYGAQCARCHGDSAQGTKQFSKNIQGTSGILHTVRQGSGLMPPFPGLSDSDVKSIELFLSTFHDPSRDTMTGMAIYQKYCSGCHGDSAQGLEGKGHGIVGRTGIDSSVRNGTTQGMPGFPWISTAKVREIEQYLGSFKLPEDGPSLYRFYCASCHGDNAQGLTGHGIALQQYKSIADPVKKGTPLMAAVKGITDSQIVKIETFLATIPLPTNGVGLYSRYCARCHGMDANGIAGNGIPLEQYTGIATVVKSGNVLMPAVTDVNDGQIRLIEQYLGTLQMPADGPTLYLRYCSSCHGPDAEGRANKGIALQQYKNIAPTVKNGTVQMPKVENITDGQIAKIEAFLGTLAGPTAGPQLFSRWCASCHGMNAEGVAGKGIALQQYQGIGDAVKKGTPQMPAIPEVSDPQITSIEKFLATLALPTDGPGLYSRYCARCHGESAQGMTGNGIALQQYQGISDAVKKGTPLMPVVSGVNDAQITKIEQFLSTLSLPTDGPGLYSRYCAQCHGETAQGMTGKGIPLQRFQGISTIVKSGNSLMTAVKTINDAQITKIEQFLGTLSLPTTGPALYMRFCSRCHGADAGGRTNNGIALQQYKNIAPTVKNGTKLMAAVPGMSDAQIALVEQYLGTLVVPNDAARIFSRFCASCHGENAVGIDGKGINLAQFTGIALSVKNGTPWMPAVRDIVDSQITSIEKWLALLPLPTTGPGLYSRFCAQCHGMDANGLTGRGIALQQYTPIANAVKNGTELMAAIPRLGDGQIAQIEQFLGTLQLPTDGPHLYSRFCAQCHGETAQGVTGKGIALQQYQGISPAVKKGTPLMPAIAGMSDAQIASIEQFLGTLALPTTGAGLYSRFCAQCHGTDASGMKDKGIALQQYPGIAPTVKNGTALMAAIKQLNDGQITQIEQYLGTLPLPANGAILYSRFCASCHSADANGVVGKGIPLQQYQGIYSAVTNGTPLMAAVKGINSAQINLVETYLSTLPLASDGQHLYARFCQSCHASDASGKPGKGIALQKFTGISTAVKVGTATMAPIPKLNDAQISVIEAYLQSFPLPVTGAGLYSRFCAQCHGESAQGMVGKGSGIQQFLGISKFVKSGGTTMPVISGINVTAPMQTE